MGMELNTNLTDIEQSLKKQILLSSDGSQLNKAEVYTAVLVYT